MFQVTTRREEEEEEELRYALKMAANTTEAPFWIPELTAAEAAASAKCMEKRELFTYVLCSLATLAGALVLTLIPRLLIAPCKRARRNAKSAEQQLLSEPSMYSNVQNWAGDLISGNTTTGRILVVFAFAASLAALVIYIWGE